MFVCMYVCPKPIRFQLFYFSSFQCSDETFLEIIDAQESESEVGFSLGVSIGQKLDQSKTSFSIFRLFGVRIKLYYISHFEKKFEENCYKKTKWLPEIRLLNSH
jgi:hypothetical protein